MSTYRSRLIRKASSDKGLRPLLLPILKSGSDIRQFLGDYFTQDFMGLADLRVKVLHTRTDDYQVPHPGQSSVPFQYANIVQLSAAVTIKDIPPTMQGDAETSDRLIYDLLSYQARKLIQEGLRDNENLTEELDATVEVRDGSFNGASWVVDKVDVERVRVEADGGDLDVTCTFRVELELITRDAHWVPRRGRDARVLRAKVLRLIRTTPRIAHTLLPLVRGASERAGAGGLLFLLDGVFAVRTPPVRTASGEAYQSLVLHDSSAYGQAMASIRSHMGQLLKLGTLAEVQGFVDRQVALAPAWSTYTYSTSE